MTFGIITGDGHVETRPLWRRDMGGRAIHPRNDDLLLDMWVERAAKHACCARTENEVLSALAHIHILSLDVRKPENKGHLGDAMDDLFHRLEIDYGWDEDDVMDWPDIVFGNA